VIPFIEIAAMHQWDANCLKIVRANSLVVEAHDFVGAWRVAVDGHIREGDSAQSQGQASRQSCRLYAWPAPDALDKLAIKLAPAGVIVAAQERVECGEQNVMRIESRVSLVCFQETTYEQAGADERDHR
jgi:hypothetical protein